MRFIGIKWGMNKGNSKEKTGNSMISVLSPEVGKYSGM